MSVQSNDILVLEAYEHVKPDMCDAYEAAGVAIDDKVRETEPGMLVHALTKVSESKDEVVYRWLEVFENPAALEAHFASPHVAAHVTKLAGTMLTAPTDLVLYCSWSEAEITAWKTAHPDSPMQFAPMKASFFLQR